MHDKVAKVDEEKENHKLANQSFKAKRAAISFRKTQKAKEMGRERERERHSSLRKQDFLSEDTDANHW